MAKVKTMGQAIVVVSEVKLDDIKKIEKYRPEALVLKGGEDGKEEIFRIGTGAGKINTYADITIYVDGSFDVATNVYGYGCVVIKKDGSIEQYYGAGNNPECVLLRNVAGEMLAAMSAVRYAIRSGCKSVNICYDYSGIEMWAIGAWKANNDLTLKYSTSMKEWQDEIAISFQKVAAHTGEKYNEMVDKLAKYAVSNFCKENKIGNEVR